MVLGHAGIPQVFLEADEVQQRLDRLVGREPTVSRMIPLSNARPF